MRAKSAVTSTKTYYEKYWTGRGDVSQHDETTPRRRALLIETLERYLKPGSTVLDLGCGAGGFTLSLCEAGFEAVGADVSEGALEQASSRAPQCQFLVLKDDGVVPAPDGSFGAVWSSEVIEHVLDVGAFLKEIHRLLVPQGLLLLTTPYHGTAKNILLALLAFDRHFDPLGDHIRFFSRRSLDRCLAIAGFETLWSKGIGRVPPLYRTLFVVARKKV